MVTSVAVDIAGMHLKNPVMPASGCFGWGEEYGRFFDLNRMGSTFHVEAIMLDVQIDPLTLVLILARVFWIEFFDVEVLDIGDEDRQAPGDSCVVAHRHARKVGLNRSDDIPAWGVEMNQVAQGWMV